MCDTRIVDLTRFKPLVFAFYICCFVLVNKHIIYLWCNIKRSWQVSNSSFECRIRSRDPGHAHLGVVLWSGSSMGPMSMSVPNLKRTALFVQKLLGGSQNFEIGSRDLGHAHFGVVLWSLRSRGQSSMSVPNLKQISLFVPKLLGVPKFRNKVTWPGPRPLRGRFIIRTEGGSFCGPEAVGVQCLCLCQIWSG